MMADNRVLWFFYKMCFILSIEWKNHVDSRNIKLVRTIATNRYKSL